MGRGWQRFAGFINIAEEKNMGALNNEEYYARNMKKGSDNYNSCWRASTRNNKMVNIEVAPPKGFSFFYRETYVDLNADPHVSTLETHRFLLLNGVEINREGQLEAKEVVRDSRTYETVLDFAKVFIQKRNLQMKSLRYLQNFRIYSFFN